jgi:hypothetical protein
MAQEYFKRTPTSSGNRKIFTYAGWFKKGKTTNRFDIFNAHSGGSQQEEIGFRQDALRYLSSGSSLYGFDTTNTYRDPVGWFHAVFVLNTTLESERKRSVLYINGVEVDTTTSSGIGAYVAKNFNSIAFNVVGKEHNVLARKYSSSNRDYVEGGAFDIFFVDGQALTPDVFGFFKDGKGYQSSGTTKVTDFRPGQWSPHSPRKIKSEIERRGGFGVNGFYLPMNDSSNFGADFHCTPNSIIKLKGEDLPQPRNGLPTTSDNYVSELRPEAGSLGFDGCVKFDGNDYLSIPKTSFQMLHKLTSSWTVEGYIFKTSDSQGTLFDTGGSSGATIGTAVYINSGGDLRLRVRQATGATVVSQNFPGSVTLNRWQHIAISYDGTSIRVFVEGKIIGTISYNTQSSTDSSSNFSIGVYDAAGGGGLAGYFTGFISNLRVIDGTALYTSNFTVPTEALTNVTNTTLLCCNSSTSATASTVTPGTITANGDPFATRNELSGSIVLAVPGVNTQPTGSELVTNGTFDTNVSGWTVTDTGSIVRQSDGTAKVTRGSSAEVVYQDITTVVGTTYELSVDITDIGGSHGQVYVKSTPHSGSLDTNIGYSFYPGTYKGTFTADTTTTRIILYAHPSGYTSYDNISVKATTIPDYHANIKGSGTNKTLTPYADASVRNPHQRHGRHVNGYYGSALSLDGTGDVLETASHADFNLGNGDYTIEGWYYDQESAINTGSRCYWAIGGVNTEGTLSLFRENAYLMLRGRSPGAGSYSNIIYVSNHNIPVGQWNHICTERFNGVTTVYINGVPLYPTEETATVSQGAFSIGAFNNSGGYPYYGYIQDVRVYKGVAKYKGGFDVPKPYAPENGDTNKGIQTWRQVSDTCKNNFATFNPIFGVGRQDQLTYSNGNLKVVSGATSGSDTTALSTIAIKGKIYCEFALTDDGLGAYVGVMKYNTALTNNGIDTTGSTDCWLIRGDNEHKANGDGGSGASYGTGTWSTGDIIMMAVDIDNTSIWFGKNGTWYASGNPAANSNAAYTNLPSTEDLLVMCGDNYSSETPTIDVNFGQNTTFGGTVTAGTFTDSNGKGLFNYQPPTGFLAMCEDNLPTPTIADPGKQFKAVTYTADDSSSMKISGVGFKPDLIWFKKRTGGSQNHTLFDSIRGVRRRLMPNTNDAESTVSGYLSSFDENGFSIGGNNFVNDNGQDYVAWCWKAGGAAVSNTDGSITSQVSANQTAGFSVVSWTSDGTSLTVGHGLNKVPSFIIQKQRDASANWTVYHKDLAATEIVKLDTDGDKETSSDFANTRPTSSVLSSFTTGVSGRKVIAYCWAEIEGFSKFGSYEGNGNADGPFVYCGFKPAWVMVKNIDDNSGRDWGIQDSSRAPSNPCNKQLKPSQSDIENSGNADSTFQIDMLSNGFKVRNNTGIWNNNGNTIIFMAFAESPFQTANAK